MRWDSTAGGRQPASRAGLATPVRMWSSGASPNEINDLVQTGNDDRDRSGRTAEVVIFGHTVVRKVAVAALALVVLAVVASCGGRESGGSSTMSATSLL